MVLNVFVHHQVRLVLSMKEIVKYDKTQVFLFFFCQQLISFAKSSVKMFMRHDERWKVTYFLFVDMIWNFRDFVPCYIFSAYMWFTRWRNNSSIHFPWTSIFAFLTWRSGVRSRCRRTGGSTSSGRLRSLGSSNVVRAAKRRYRWMMKLKIASKWKNSSLCWNYNDKSTYEQTMIIYIYMRKNPPIFCPCMT